MATARKAATVTGAASGLGRAMALGLVESGMDVVAVDRNATALAILGSGGHKAGAPIAWLGLARMPIEPT
jgi:NAD(P)-dependent dehydrogenase (short-subunit alcohol dehydrogenase family)